MIQIGFRPKSLGVLSAIIYYFTVFSGRGLAPLAGWNTKIQSPFAVTKPHLGTAKVNVAPLFGCQK